MPKIFDGRRPRPGRVEDRAIEGPAGEIGVRVYTPEVEGARHAMDDAAAALRDALAYNSRTR